MTHVRHRGHHYQSLNKKEEKKICRIQVRSNRTTGIPGNRPTRLRDKYITSINKSGNTGEESGCTKIRSLTYVTERGVDFFELDDEEEILLERASKSNESATITFSFYLGGKKNNYKRA